MDPYREFRLGDWLVTPLRGVIRGESGSRRLTPKAMDVLLCLARRHGEVVERDLIVQEVWRGRAASDEPLNKAIAELRRQLGDDRGAPSYIETIPKRGYRVIADFEPVGDSAAVPRGPDRTRQHRRLRYLAIVALSLVAAGLLAARFLQPDTPSRGPVRIAVLPFAVLSSADTKQYFADGVHEELITALSRNTRLEVRSRTSTLRFRDLSLSLPEIAAELDADVIVEGTVRQEHDRVRVTAQLVEARTDAHLWSENYERSLSVADLFAIQNEIAGQISAALELALAAPGTGSGGELPTDDLNAYDSFLLGKYHYRRQLPGDMRIAVEKFEAAVALDPDFADAWDWLAYAYNHAATAVGHLSPHVAYPKARAAALRALEIRPDLATAISILGYIRAVYDWDWVGAEADLRRAIALDPHDSGTVWSLAHVLSLLGRHDEAIALTVNFAAANPEIGRRHREVANRMIDAGRFDDALLELHKAAEHGDETAQVEDTAGVALLGMGDIPAAAAKFEFAVQAKQRAPDTIARLAFALAASGRRAEAEALRDELLRRSQAEQVSALTLATVYAGLDDRATALGYLEQAAEDRDRAILGVRNDPFFRGLHDEARFLALIAGFRIPTD